jgi:putative endonuclease
VAPHKKKIRAIWSFFILILLTAIGARFGSMYSNKSMFYVYILYSSSANKFYIGQTYDLNNRISEHNNGIFKGSFTSQASDWEYYVIIECSSRQQALNIEQHIKRMRTRTYYKNLKNCPDLSAKLIALYKSND